VLATALNGDLLATQAVPTAELNKNVNQAIPFVTSLLVDFHGQDAQLPCLISSFYSLLNLS